MSSIAGIVVEDVHLLPVGFDYERLIQPISASDGLPADRVVILFSAVDSGDERVEELVHRLVDKLQEDVERVLRLEAERAPVEPDIFNYSDLYEFAHTRIMAELEKGNNVYVNISSMPRTVAFAFATAAESIVLENSDYRDSVTTYYASPEQYLVLDMIEQLQEELDFLEGLRGRDIPKVDERYEKVENLVSKLERGVSEGVRELNGGLHVEIPAPPIANLRGREKEILWFLHERGEISSTTQLAKELAEVVNEDYGDTFRSNVQYNTRELEKKGFVDRREEGNSYPTKLSKMGSLWARTHERESSDPIW